MCRHADECADGDHAGTANAVQQDVVRGDAGGSHGVGQVAEMVVFRRACFGLFDAHVVAADGDETGAKTIDARIIFVARRLVDAAFSSKFGFFRQNGNAIRLHTAIATAFAHHVVDKGEYFWVFECAFFAATAFFGGADLIVNQHAGACNGAQFLLYVIHVGAIVDGHRRRQYGAISIT